MPAGDSRGGVCRLTFTIAGFSSARTSVCRESVRTFLGPTGTPLVETHGYTDQDENPIAPDSCERRADNAPAAKRFASDRPLLTRQ